MKIIITPAVNKAYGLALVIFAIVVTFSSKSFSQTIIVLGEQKTKEVELTVGKSAIFKSASPLKYTTVADPMIAEAVSLSPYELYVTAKAPGRTRLTISPTSGGAFVYDLNVAYDVAGLKQKLREMLPGEEGIQVVATEKTITLSGRVSSTAKLSQVLAIAQGFAPKEGINNLLEVAGVQQVMLEVRVAEMSKSLMKRLGFNFAYLNGGDFALTQLGQLAQLTSRDENLTVGPLDLLVSPSVNALFRFHRGSSSWTNFIDALKEDGLVRVLAEPTLIALSGQNANFLAGGEFPVPVPQGLGTAAIEFKPFGVNLSFTPIVLEDKKINIKVTPEVSELDFSTAITFGGYVVPGLTTRRASTTVELGDGQSFAIAGLLKETNRDSLSKYPLLGEVPVLGALFRSRGYQKNETELIIVVTPHLVKPLDQEKQSLPTDYYVEPNAWEFYGLGLMEGKGSPRSSLSPGELEGDFGHAIPLQ